MSVVINPERSSAEGGDERLLLALTTEHFTLQAARATTVTESAGRATLFVVMVSSGMVALAFTGQATDLGPSFWALALLLLPALFVLGTLTYLRLVQSAVDDLEFARAIDRIHGYYRGLAPEAPLFFPPGAPAGGAPVPGAGAHGRHHLHSHSATMVLVVVSLIAGAGAGAGVAAAGSPMPGVAVVGAAAAVATAGVFVRHHAAVWRDAVAAGW
jgi:uncharacterized protein (DUF983 family)